MSTQFTNRQWRLPNNENKDKQSNYSMDFDGTQYINAGSENYITSSNFNISISAWINIDTTLGEKTIVSSNRNNSGAYVFKLIVNNNSVSFGARTASSPAYTTITGSTTLSTNTWYHVCVTWDMANFNLYLNGVSDATAVSATTFLDSTSKILGIGGRASIYGSGGGTNYFNGKLDAVSIFNYALSSSQVTTLYGSSSTGIGNPMSLSPKPVAYYPLGDQDGRPRCF
jgi:MSHA biogenesis protein MshQ